jgi:hypothetical protein
MGPVRALVQGEEVDLPNVAWSGTDIFGTNTLACRDEGIIWCLQGFTALTEGWV